MSHTPAVYINDSFHQPGVQNYLDQNGMVVMSASLGNQRVQGYLEERPISVHSSKTASGWRAPKAFHHQSQSVRAPYCTVTWTLDPPIPNWYQAVQFPGYTAWDVSNPGWDFSDYNWMEDQAITQALLRLKDQKLNLGVAFAERRETAKLLENTCEGIRTRTNRYKERYTSDWRKVLKTNIQRDRRNARRNFPKSFLELQYGWKPLLSDLYGAAEALANRDVLGNRYTAHVTGRASTRSTEEYVHECVYISPHPGFDVHVTKNVNVFVRLDYELGDIVLQTLSQLGVTNPLEILWERVPYSFVVDWLLPIGNWLSCLDAALGWDFKGGSMSTRKTNEGRGGRCRMIQPVHPQYAATFSNQTEAQRYKHEVNEFHRKVYTSSPLPMVPHFRNPFTPGRTANALALLAQAMETSIRR